METWLLALDLAGVATEKALSLEDFAERRLMSYESTGDAMSDRLRLSALARPADDDIKIVRIHSTDRLEWRVHDIKEIRTVDVFVESTTIDRGSACTEEEANLSDSGLSFAEGVSIGRSSGHIRRILNGEHSRLLGIVLVRIARLETEAEEHTSAEFILREHTGDREAEHLGRLLFLHLAERSFLETTHIVGMPSVELVFDLVSRDDDLVGIEDDDVVAIIEVVREIDFILALYVRSNEGRDASEGLTLRIDAVPLSLGTCELLRLESFHSA